MNDDTTLPAVNRAVRRILQHPYGKVCKHWMIATLLSELEAAGHPQPDGFVRAVIHADDETALAYADIFSPDIAEKGAAK